MTWSLFCNRNWKSNGKVSNFSEQLCQDFLSTDTYRGHILPREKHRCQIVRSKRPFWRSPHFKNTDLRCPRDLHPFPLSEQRPSRSTRFCSGAGTSARDLLFSPSIGGHYFVCALTSRIHAFHTFYSTTRSLWNKKTRTPQPSGASDSCRACSNTAHHYQPRHRI